MGIESMHQKSINTRQSFTFHRSSKLHAAATRKRKQEALQKLKTINTSHQVIMKAQHFISIALVASLLILQLTPPTLARRTSSTGTEATDATALSAQCVVSIVNSINMIANSIITSVAQGIAICPAQCDLGALQCVGCILGLVQIPTIPAPDSLAGCT